MGYLVLGKKTIDGKKKILVVTDYKKDMYQIFETSPFGKKRKTIATKVYATQFDEIAKNWKRKKNAGYGY